MEFAQNPVTVKRGTSEPADKSLLAPGLSKSNQKLLQKQHRLHEYERRGIGDDAVVNWVTSLRKDVLPSPHANQALKRGQFSYSKRMPVKNPKDSTGGDSLNKGMLQSSSSSIPASSNQLEQVTSKEFLTSSREEGLHHQPRLSSTLGQKQKKYVTPRNPQIKRVLTKDRPTIIQEEEYFTPERTLTAPADQVPSKSTYAKAIGQKTLQGLAAAAHVTQEGISKAATLVAHEAKIGLNKAKELIHEATAPAEDTSQPIEITEFKPISYQEVVYDEEGHPLAAAEVEIDYDPATHLLYQEGSHFKSPKKQEFNRKSDAMASKTTAMHTIGGHSLNIFDSGYKRYPGEMGADHLSVSQDLSKYFREQKDQEEHIRQEIEEIKEQEKLIQEKQEQAIYELAEITVQKDLIDQKEQELLINLKQLEEKVRSSVPQPYLEKITEESYPTQENLKKVEGEGQTNQFYLRKYPWDDDNMRQREQLEQEDKGRYAESIPLTQQMPEVPYSSEQMPATKYETAQPIDNDEVIEEYFIEGQERPPTMTEFGLIEQQKRAGQEPTISVPLKQGTSQPSSQQAAMTILTSQPIEVKERGIQFTAPLFEQSQAGVPSTQEVREYELADQRDQYQESRQMPSMTIREQKPSSLPLPSQQILIQEEEPIYIHQSGKKLTSQDRAAEISSPFSFAPVQMTVSSSAAYETIRQTEEIEQERLRLQAEEARLRKEKMEIEIKKQKIEIDMKRRELEMLEQRREQELRQQQEQQMRAMNMKPKKIDLMSQQMQFDASKWQQRAEKSVKQDAEIQYNSKECLPMPESVEAVIIYEPEPVYEEQVIIQKSESPKQESEKEQKIVEQEDHLEKEHQKKSIFQKVKEFFVPSHSKDETKKEEEHTPVLTYEREPEIQREDQREFSGSNETSKIAWPSLQQQTYQEQPILWPSMYGKSQINQSGAERDSLQVGQSIVRQAPPVTVQESQSAYNQKLKTSGESRVSEISKQERQAPMRQYISMQESSEQLEDRFAEQIKQREGEDFVLFKDEPVHNKPHPHIEAPIQPLYYKQEQDQMIEPPQYRQTSEQSDFVRRQEEGVTQQPHIMGQVSNSQLRQSSQQQERLMTEYTAQDQLPTQQFASQQQIDQPVNQRIDSYAYSQARESDQNLRGIGPEVQQWKIPQQEQIYQQRSNPEEMYVEQAADKVIQQQRQPLQGSQEMMEVRQPATTVTYLKTSQRGRYATSAQNPAQYLTSSQSSRYATQQVPAQKVQQPTQERQTIVTRETQPVVQQQISQQQYQASQEVINAPREVIIEERRAPQIRQESRQEATTRVAPLVYERETQPVTQGQTQYYTQTQELPLKKKMTFKEFIFGKDEPTQKGQGLTQSERITQQYPMQTQGYTTIQRGQTQSMPSTRDKLTFNEFIWGKETEEYRQKKQQQQIEAEKRRKKREEMLAHSYQDYQNHMKSLKKLTWSEFIFGKQTEEEKQRAMERKRREEQQSREYEMSRPSETIFVEESQRVSEPAIIRRSQPTTTPQTVVASSTIPVATMSQPMQETLPPQRQKSPGLFDEILDLFGCGSKKQKRGTSQALQSSQRLQPLTIQRTPLHDTIENIPADEAQPTENVVREYLVQPVPQNVVREEVRVRDTRNMQHAQFPEEEYKEEPRVIMRDSRDMQEYQQQNVQSSLFSQPVVNEADCVYCNKHIENPEDAQRRTYYQSTPGIQQQQQQNKVYYVSSFRPTGDQEQYIHGSSEGGYKSGSIRSSPPGQKQNVIYTRVTQPQPMSQQAYAQEGMMGRKKILDSPLRSIQNKSLSHQSDIAAEDQADLDEFSYTPPAHQRPIQYYSQQQQQQFQQPGLRNMASENFPENLTREQVVYRQ